MSEQKMNTAVKNKETLVKDNSSPQLPIGKRLKTAREKKGLSLDIVHEGTKIPLDALGAIEEGYSVRTLSPFYYKGFLKIYGEYLDIDINEIVSGSDLFKEKDEPNLDEEYRSFFFRDLLANIFNIRKMQHAISILLIGLILFGLFKVIVFIFHRSDSAPSEEISVSVSTQDEQVTNKPALPKPRVVVPKPVILDPVEQKVISSKDTSKAVPVPQTVMPQPSAPVLVQPPEVSVSAVQPAVKNVTLVIRARTDSWLRVTVDGQIVFQSTLNMGAVKTWLADDEIKISGRNLEQLEMELNGKMVGPLGRKQRGAKSILIKEGGLTVIQ